jgi:tetratricopeptide (TPR) repeat protein
MKKMFPKVAALAAFGAFYLVSSNAQASEAHEARVLYQKGNVAFAGGDSILARDYYRKSLAKQESFDTLCNLGRAEAQDKLFPEAYEHLGYCVALYPEDEELADARSKFVELRAEVRLRLASDVISAIDEKIEDDMAARAAREKALAEGPASGLDDEPVEPEPEEPQMEKVKWKLPVVLSLAGAGVASGVFGGVMFGVSGGQMREAEDLREGLGESGCFDSDSAKCGEVEDQLTKADNSKNLGVGFLAGGGAALFSALVLYIVVPNEREVKAASGFEARLPLVSAGADGVSISVSGSF